MKNLKKILHGILISFCLIIISTFLFTLLNYFNIINSATASMFGVTIPLISLAVAGFISGKKSLKNGWLEGFKIGLVFVTLIFLGNIIFDFPITIKNLLFYLLLLSSSVLGSVFGINYKKEK